MEVALSAIVNRRASSIRWAGGSARGPVRFPSTGAARARAAAWTRLRPLWPGPRGWTCRTGRVRASFPITQCGARGSGPRCRRSTIGPRPRGLGSVDVPADRGVTDA